MVDARVFIVDALNDHAERFYRKFCFELLSTVAKRAIHLPMADAEATLASLH